MHNLHKVAEWGQTDLLWLLLLLLGYGWLLLRLLWYWWLLLLPSGHVTRQQCTLWRESLKGCEICTRQLILYRYEGEEEWGRGGDFNKEKCKWMEIASHDLCSTFVNCAGTADVLLYMWASFIAVSLSCYFLLLHAIMFPCCNSLTCVVGSWHREWGQETGRCHGNHWSSQRLGHLGGT